MIVIYKLLLISAIVCFCRGFNGGRISKFEFGGSYVRGCCILKSISKEAIPEPKGFKRLSPRFPKKVKRKDRIPAPWPPPLSPPPIVPAQLCSCKSGLSYENCCLPVHDFKLNPKEPEKVLRARYTAYKHGIADYIIATSSEKNEDYEKYTILSFAGNGDKKWRKEISSLATENDYFGMEIISSDVLDEIVRYLLLFLFLVAFLLTSTLSVLFV